jgi:hypothetical protein
MKKSVFLLLFFFVGLIAQAQKVYFIYIQSDTGTPFFLKMDQKVHSSSASGYIILSGLKDSVYNFSIGFPGKQQENKFSVTINKEDRGFLLRTVENQPALFDLQSLVLYKATAGIKEPEYNIPELMAQADGFTKLLSLATDDPSILVSGPSQPKTQMLASSEAMVDTNKTVVVIEKPAVDSLHLSETLTKAERKPEDTTSVTLTEKPAPVINTDVVVNKQADLPRDTVVNTTSLNTEPPTQEVKPVIETVTQAEQAYQRSIVTRRSESSTTEGFGLVFLDNTGDRTDTIRLLIPNPKMVARILPVKQEEARVIEDKVEQKAEAAEKPALANTCKEIATDKDFLKLRKIMAAEETDEAMVKAAVKYFSKKCFSTEQIKNLSALFLTPAGKYDFFTAAYAFTSDKDVFSSLQSELRDEYYTGLFKDLVGGR